MNISSVPLTYSTTSSDTGFIAQDMSTVLSDTITISGGTGYTIGSNAGTYTIATSGTVTLDSINTSTFNWKMPEEFVDAFPDYTRIEKMCKEYPGLAIAFEKFKTTYKLVKDHYDTPEDQRPKP
jgi:hypothetical protein